MTRHLPTTEASGIRRLIPACSVVAVCAAGLALGWGSGLNLPRAQSISAADDPTLPLLFALRLIVVGLSTWIGGWTIIALVARLFGRVRTLNLALRVLPSFVSRSIRRSLVLGLSGALLINTTAMASQLDPRTPTGAVSGKQQAAREYGGDVTNGQRWPAALTGEPVINDPDVPTLVAVAGPPRSVTSTTARPTTAAPTTVSSGPSSSIPQPGVVSLPQPTIGTAISSVPVTSVPVTSVPAYRRPTTSLRLNQPTSLSPPTRGTSPERHYTVVAGDHFWSIAEQTILLTNPQADETTIRTYWSQLIQENKKLLKDPNNPDLLMVGTKLVLPPWP
jgi:hypothetical protein